MLILTDNSIQHPCFNICLIVYARDDADTMRMNQSSEGILQLGSKSENVSPAPKLAKYTHELLLKFEQRGSFRILA